MHKYFCPYRSKSCLQAQRSRLNQQKLCKVNERIFLCLVSQMFFLPPFPIICCYLSLFSLQNLKFKMFLSAETLEKLTKKEEQCTSLTTESEALRSQLAGENICIAFYVKCFVRSLHYCWSMFFSPFCCWIITTKLKNINSSCLYPGLERKLKAADEKLEQLSKDKSKLENDISDMMKASGDSSVQLTKMNEDLIQKERYYTLLFPAPVLLHYST